MKDITTHITELKLLLPAATGKHKIRIAEEIINAQFELAHLVAKTIITDPVIILLAEPCFN